MLAWFVLMDGVLAVTSFSHIDEVRQIDDQISSDLKRLKESWQTRVTGELTREEMTMADWSGCCDACGRRSPDCVLSMDGALLVCVPCNVAEVRDIRQRIPFSG